MHSHNACMARCSGRFPHAASSRNKPWQCTNEGGICKDSASQLVWPEAVGYNSTRVSLDAVPSVLPIYFPCTWILQQTCIFPYPETNCPSCESNKQCLSAVLRCACFQVLKRRMHAAFSQWAHTALTHSAAIHLLAQHLFRLMCLSFAQWARLAFTRSAASQLLARRLRTVQSRTFLHWRIVAAGRRYRAIQLFNIRETLAAHPGTLCATADCALRRWRMGPAAASSFDLWRSRAAFKKDQLDSIGYALKHMQHWRLKRTFHTWCACIQYLARNQLEGIRMEGLMCEGLVDTTLQTWCEATRCAVKLADREAAAASCFFAHLALRVRSPPPPQPSAFLYLSVLFS